MDIVKKIENLKPIIILKTIGIVIIGFILIILAAQLIKSVFSSNYYSNGMKKPYIAQMEESYQMAAPAYDGRSEKLSVRNIMPPIRDDFSTGADSEDFEVTEYHATIETRELDSTCSKISSLKSKVYVVFENSNERDSSCNYTFKVKKDRLSEILAIVKGLNPRDISENTFTIKQEIDDFISETEVLEREIEYIEKALEEAVKEYDETSKLARETQDVESLAKIIDLKFRIIEKSTQRKIIINKQLERLERSKAEQLDRLEYTYFYINIYENKYVDLEAIKDSWKYSIKSFVHDTNKILQDVTINLVKLFTELFKIALYFFILLIVVKYGWRATKRLWTK